MLSKGISKPSDVFRPFLFAPKIMNGRQYFIADSVDELYRIRLNEESLQTNVLRNDKEIELLKKLPFGKETKDMYYGIFESFGTHIIQEASFGIKGEFTWQLDKVEKKKNQELEK